MNIQIEQLISLIYFILICIAFYKIKNIYSRVILVFIIFVIFIMSPIKFKQEGMAKVERRSTDVFTELPERVSSNKLSFDEKQKKQINELKKQSKEDLKNETN